MSSVSLPAPAGMSPGPLPDTAAAPSPVSLAPGPAAAASSFANEMQNALAGPRDEESSNAGTLPSTDSDPASGTDPGATATHPPGKTPGSHLKFPPQTASAKPGRKPVGKLTLHESPSSRTPTPLAIPACLTPTAVTPQAQAEFPADDFGFVDATPADDRAPALESKSAPSGIPGLALTAAVFGPEPTPPAPQTSLVPSPVGTVNPATRNDLRWRAGESGAAVQLLPQQVGALDSTDEQAQDSVQGAVIERDVSKASFLRERAGYFELATAEDPGLIRPASLRPDGPPPVSQTGDDSSMVLPEIELLTRERPAASAESASERTPPARMPESAVRSTETAHNSVHHGVTRIPSADATSPPAPDGMGRAETSSRMKNAPETGRIRQIAGQELPGRPAMTGPAPEAPRASAPAAPALDGDPRVDSQPPGTASESVTALAHAGAPDSVRDTAPASESSGVSASTGIIQELRVAIPTHAVELRQARGEALMVVLRPDAHTAIHLQLLGRDGEVDVRAQLEHGNFQALNAQWSELQQTLSVQGIRLGELRDTGTSPFSGGDGSGAFSRPGRGPEHPETGRANLARTLPPPKTRTTPALTLPRAASGRSWESWA